MNLSPGRLKDVVGGAREEDTTVVCHQTLQEPLQATCRGYVDAYASESGLWRLAAAQGVIVYDDPPRKES